MKQARSFSILLCVLLVPTILLASERPRDAVGRMSASASSVQWLTSGNFEKATLRVVAPDGRVYEKEFLAGTMPSFRLHDFDKAGDGAYTYELRAVPRISDSVKAELREARAADDDAAIERIQRANGIGDAPVQSGTLTVVNGSFINSDADEAPSVSPRAKVNAAPSTSAQHPATPLDIVQADDVIIQGSLCVGLDCVVNESFGFDTIRLKENNTRIKFDDTSTSSGFPNNDWQLTANDSASGGANKFSIDDVTNSKTPFTVTGNSPTNSLFIASTGKVGFGNSSPGLNLHITATDTPAVRQEQTSGGGFTAQTWDIGANEANWFVRDVTGGSRLPLRIRPGAPTSSVDISASGNVGIGTASPSFQLDVVTTGTAAIVNRTFANNASGIASSRVVSGNGTSSIRQAYQQFIANETTNIDWRDGMLGSNDFRISDFTSGLEANRLTINSSGNIGIGGITNPGNPLQHSSGAFLSAGGTWTNASSRDYKQDICDLDSHEALATLKELAPVKYAYKVDPSERHVGFIAEDVPDLVATKDRKGLSPMDIVAVLAKVVQDQQKTIDDLNKRLDEVEKKQ